MAVATRRRAEPASEPRTETGVSLARGPALILGTILLAAGLYFLYRQHTFPQFSNFPSGHAHVVSKVLGIFGANGWTGMLTAICGGLLLFGAAEHVLAKTMSLLVGIVLAAAAIIGAVNSGNVLGLVAANGWTEIAWGIAAVILLFNTLIPRRRHTVEPVYDERSGRRGSAAGAVAGGGAVAAAEHERGAHREGVEDRQGAVGQPAGERGTAGVNGAGNETAVQDRGGPAGTPTEDATQTEQRRV